LAVYRKGKRQDQRGASEDERDWRETVEGHDGPPNSIFPPAHWRLAESDSEMQEQGKE